MKAWINIVLMIFLIVGIAVAAALGLVILIGTDVGVNV